jgi:hypothetical protein
MMSMTPFSCVSSAALDESSETEQPGDRRFSELMTMADWLQLPTDVRRRFSKKLGSGAAIYTGHVSLHPHGTYPFGQEIRADIH